MLDERGVQHPQQSAGLRVAKRIAAHYMACRGRNDRSVGALPAHVAERHAPVALGHLEHVVEVAANLSDRRPVHSGDVESRHPGRCRRNQRLLQRVNERGGLRLALVGSRLALVGSPNGEKQFVGVGPPRHVPSADYDAQGFAGSRKTLAS